MKRVVLGGTFDVLHEGHKALLRKAFSLGQVIIGLTSNRMAEESKKRKVRDFKKRKRDLGKFISNEFSKKPKIIKIEDRFGPALKQDFDYIVVSPATYKTAVFINKKRKKLGKRSIKIVKINFVRGKNGKPISATEILKNAGLRNKY